MKKISLLMLCFSLLLSLSLSLAKATEAATTFNATATISGKEYPIKKQGDIIIFNVEEYLTKYSDVNESSNLEKFSFSAEKSIKTITFDYHLDSIDESLVEELTSWDKTLEVNSNKAEYSVPEVLGESDNGQDGVSIGILLDLFSDNNQLTATANVIFEDGTEEDILFAINQEANGWVKIAKTWFYFEDGTMQTGWVKDKDKWYFLDNSGAMKTGWVKDSNKWYFLDNSGAMKTGWVKDSNKWYFLNTNGSMATNTTINGYKVDQTGAWIQ